jgi:hypothetical protein
VLWIAIAALMLVLFARRPIELRRLGLTFAAAAVAQIIVTEAYIRSFG